MVWSQYVYEADIGFDAPGDFDAADETEEENVLLNIEDWEIEYSDELHYMWGIIRTLLYDAHLECKGEFADFVLFCYTDHDEGVDDATDEEDMVIFDIWKHLKRTQSPGMMRGANFNNFKHFMKKYICV